MTTDTAAPLQPPPDVGISSQQLGSAGALETFRAAVSPVFHCWPADEHANAFRCAAHTWHLGNMMIGSFRCSAMHFERSAQLAAASGLDHVLIQYYSEGSFDGVAGPYPMHVDAGDICLFDMTSTLRTRSTDFHNLSLMVPRSYLEATIDDVSMVHGMVLSHDESSVQVAADFLTALARRLPAMSLQDAANAAAVTVSLIISLIRKQRPRLGQTDAKASPFRTAARYIEHHLSEESLSPDSVARACNMSRASLYRLFEPVGGVSHYIRRTRLVGAAVALSSTQACGERVEQIARRHGFSSESSFTRAFRAQFGMTPSEARRAVNRNWTVAATQAGDASADQRFTTWLRTL